MMNKYTAFLRGINVGGHHKVPMAELKKELEKIGLVNVITLLNSGNVLFNSEHKNVKVLEETIEVHLEKVFGFSIPTIVIESEKIVQLLQSDPFQSVEVDQDIRLYVSFIKSEVSTNDLVLPWSNADDSYKIIEQNDNMVMSVLNVSAVKTVDAMNILEKKYGKDITTRNWNTIKRIEKKLEDN